MVRIALRIRYLGSCGSRKPRGLHLVSRAPDLLETARENRPRSAPQAPLSANKGTSELGMIVRPKRLSGRKAGFCELGGVRRRVSSKQSPTFKPYFLGSTFESLVFGNSHMHSALFSQRQRTCQLVASLLLSGLRTYHLMGGCQNYGSLLGPLNTRCRIILRTKKGP